jgi:transposase InsO family protein
MRLSDRDDFLATFDGKNYGEWSTIMMFYLQSKLLWSVVDYEGELAATEKANDAKARGLICMSVDLKYAELLRETKTAKEAWLKLKKLFEDNTIWSVIQLRTQLYELKYDGDILTHIASVERIKRLLHGTHAPTSQPELIAALLKSLPESWRPFLEGLRSNHSVLENFEKVKEWIVGEAKIREHLESPEDSRTALLSKLHPLQAPLCVCDNCGKRGHTIERCWAKGGGAEGNGRQRRNAQGNAHSVAGPVWRRPSGTSEHFLFTSATSDLPSTNDLWLLDTGASNHMTARRDLLSDFQSVSTGAVTVANGDKLPVVGKGNLRFRFPVQGGFRIGTLSDVLYIPQIQRNLISGPCMDKKGYLIKFQGGKCNVCLPSGEELLSGGLTDQGLYQMNISPKDESSLHVNVVFSNSEQYSLWHRRMGHLHHASLKQLLTRNGITVSPTTGHLPCESCVVGKMHKLPFNKKQEKRSTEILQLVHSDVCGPMEEVTHGGYRYFVTFLDDFSHVVVVYLLRSKSEVSDKLKEYYNMATTQHQRKLQRLRIDNGTEYVNRSVTDFCKANGILLEPTNPYTPQQNGTAERMNRTLVESGRAMLAQAQLSKKYWGEALLTAAYLRNRSPTHTLKRGETPMEIWSGAKPSLHNIRVFGCICFAFVPKEKRQKWDPKAVKCMFLGYTHNGYRVENLQTGMVLITRNVIFEENIFGTQSIAERRCLAPQPDLPTDEATENVENASDCDSSYEDAASRTTSQTASDSVSNQEEEFSQQENSHCDDRSVHSGPTAVTDADSEPLEQLHSSPFQSAPSRRQTRQTTDLTSAKIGDLLCPSTHVAQLYTDPISYNQAMNGPNAKQWESAINSEYDSLIENDTWELAELPPGRKAISTKWVFKTKKNQDGSIHKHKARLVARGFKQQEGIDYTETFSPVVRITTIRLLIAISAIQDLEMSQLDIKTAFLYGTIDEEIYVTQPEGRIKKGQEHLVCRLNKSLYGLKQAPRIWNEHIHQFFVNNGLQQTKADPCVFTWRDAHHMLIVCIWVDDILIFTNCPSKRTSLVNNLQKRYQTTDLGDLNYIVGLEVHRDRGTQSISLCQLQYLESKIEAFGQTAAQPISIPLSPGVCFDSVALNIPSKAPYREAVGGLMYAMTSTRPDIAFATSFMSQYFDSYGSAHWNAAKRIFQYLNATKDLQLQYCGRNKSVDLEVYVDADFANCPDDRKSRSGYVILMAGAAISWYSKKQQTIALSTAEAEYVAATSAVQEVLWLRSLLGELGFPQTSPTTVFEDNQACIAITTNPITNSRTKHIDIKYHWLREKVLSRDVAFQYCPSRDMAADIFTKALPKPAFTSCRCRLGLLPLSLTRGKVGVLNTKLV